MFATGQETNIEQDGGRGQDWVVDLRSRRIVRRGRLSEPSNARPEPAVVDKEGFGWPTA